jgi:nickel-dependent lactate racemase
MYKVYELSYGNKNVKVKLPIHLKIQIMKMREHNAIVNITDAVRIALDNPIGSKKLRHIAKNGNKRVCIIVPDRTRPIPIKQLLEIVLQELLESGIKKEHILILFALGTHRLMSKKEMESIVGNLIINNYRCINHEWMDEKNLVLVSKTPKGIPITVNKALYESDIKIAIGGVNPHRVAGWSGGAKAIVPGVCGEEATGYTHWLSALIPAEEIYGVVENPVRKEMEIIAQKVGLDFIINCVGNHQYEPSAIYSGDFIEAHRKCVEIGKKIYEVEVKEKKDLIISGTGPYVSDMWNTGCGPGELIIKNGGTSIVLSPCKDGISKTHPEIEKYGYLLGLEEVKKLVSNGEIQDLSSAAHLIHAGDMLTRRNVNCTLVSEGISKEEAASLGLNLEIDPQVAIENALKSQSKETKVGIFTGHSSNYLYYV